MKLKTMLSYLVILVLVVLQVACERKQIHDTATQKPNVILLLADDQRYSIIHRLGVEQIVTPNLDKLSEQGITYSHAHIMGAMNGAVCAPSRAMLMTGRNVFSIVPSGEDIDKDHITLPQHLKNNGYYTFHTGKWHNGRGAFTRSFSGGENIFFGGMSDHYKVPLNHFDSSGNYAPDEIFFLNQHSTDIYANTAVDFLKSYAREEPFFLSIAFQAPHDPRQVPEKYLRMYAPDSLDPGKNFMPEHPFDNGELNIRDEWLTEVPRNKAEVKMHLAAYYAMVTHIDDRIGEILKTLEMSGFEENTYIIFTADNGLAVGQHGLMGKQNVYEHSIRVPMVIKGPKISEGTINSSFIYLFDLYPTICDFVELNVPVSVQGGSFIAHGYSPRSSAFFAYKNFQRALKTEKYKMIVYNVQGQQKTQLFDIESDPWELNDLSNKSDHLGNVNSLKNILNEGIQSAGDSADVFMENWGVMPYPSWIDKVQKRNPAVLEKLRTMAEEENDMVKDYWE